MATDTLPTETTTLRACVAPIPAAFLARARDGGRDDLGQPVKRTRARGGEPCRDALRRASPGEELILASFSPFSLVGPYREYGPIFVLANDAAAISSNVIQAGTSTDYLRDQFVIRAYSAGEEILDATLVTPQSAQATIDRFFARSNVAFLHVRFPTYGCFACRLDRGPKDMTA